MHNPSPIKHSRLRKCLYLYLGDTEKYGLGLFAARAISSNEKIIIDDSEDYYQDILTYEQLCDRGYDFHHDAVQIGRNAFVLPNENLDDFMNHSCTPNCGISFTAKGYYVITLRDIDKDEELTYDYSTQMSFDHTPLPCRCDSANCRGEIANFETLPEPLQDHYIALGIVADFAIEAAMSKRNSGAVLKIKT